MEVKRKVINGNRKNWLQLKLFLLMGWEWVGRCGRVWGYVSVSVCMCMCVSVCVCMCTSANVKKGNRGEK